MLSIDLPAARQMAQQWVEASPAMLQDAAALMAGILTSRFAGIRTWGGALLPSVGFSEEQSRVIIVRIVAHLMGLDDRTEHPEEMVRDVGALFLEHWTDACSRIDLPVIQDLLQHPLTALQSLGARLLLNHRTPPEKLPPDLIGALIESEAPELRGLGVQLFSGLPREMLFTQADLIFSFCISRDREVREAVFPLVRQLAGERADFGLDLFHRLLPHIFRKEPVEGFHQDLTALLADALETSARTLDRNTIWRLLQARSKGAWQLGARLLDRTAPDKFTVRQWARLGNHPVLSVRQWVWGVYLESEAAAAVAAPIFNRVSATIAVGDRGDCVRILRDIALKHPRVPTRLKLKPVELRPTKAPEASYAI